MTTITLPELAMTLDHWVRLRNEDPDHRYELVDGNLTIMPPASSNHAAVVTELTVWLAAHGYPARRILADAGMATTTTRGRVPDLVLLHTIVPDTTYLDPSMVLLVVEVVSPGSEDDDRRIKPAEYAKAGVEFFWRVENAADPDSAIVNLYRLADGEYLRYRVATLPDLLNDKPPLT